MLVNQRTLYYSMEVCNLMKCQRLFCLILTMTLIPGLALAAPYAACQPDDEHDPKRASFSTEHMKRLPLRHSAERLQMPGQSTLKNLS